MIEIIALKKDAPAFETTGTLLALGCFDGLHKGHAALLHMAKEKAEQLNIPFSVWSLVGAKGDVPQLQTKKQKLKILEKLGADYALFEDFSEIRDLSYQTFFREYLVKNLHCKALAAGEDFRFGKNASGTFEDLQALGKEANLPVFIQNPVTDHGRVISSNLIRSALKDGKIADASALLGRPFSIEGTVIHGRKVGRNLGFPTLNLPLPHEHLLKYGVYLVGVHYKGHLYPAIANAGVHPTFPEGRALLEAHILFKESFDLYGEPVEVEFYKFVREERRFTNQELLRVQVKKDIEEACLFFGL